jgi:hypothetical protein
MADDSKYGKLDIPGIPDDEPVFVLRAKDKLAVRTLYKYEILAMSRGGSDIPQEFLDNVTQVIDKFEEWAEKNPDKMKLPD